MSISKTVAVTYHRPRTLGSLREAFTELANQDVPADAKILITGSQGFTVSATWTIEIPKAEVPGDCRSTWLGEVQCTLPFKHPGLHLNNGATWVGAEGIKRDGTRKLSDSPQA